MQNNDEGGFDLASTKTLGKLRCTKKNNNNNNSNAN